MGAWSPRRPPLGAFAGRPTPARFGRNPFQTAITDFAYSGTELDAVAEADNYYRWIVDRFAPHLGRRIVEAGAGIGTVSELLLRRAAPDTMLLIEPDRGNVAELRRRFTNDARVRIHHGYLEDTDPSFAADTIVAVNVLEHVGQPAGFLDAAYERLTPGGALLILVPALPAIYGSLDKAFEHYRRYTRPELEKDLSDAGFEVEQLHYMNVVGIAGWLVAGKVMRRTTLGRGQVRFYDRWVIPWLRRLESIAHPPIGQSVIAVARLPETLAHRLMSLELGRHKFGGRGER
jgi:SAM-dependent methyltransferase